jgi:hypothetical protein
MAQFIVEGGRPLNGTVTVSGNKNEALPAVMACLLTEEEIILKRMPKIGDILTLCNILEDIGVSVSWLDEETLSLQAKTIKTHRRIQRSVLKLAPLYFFLDPFWHVWEKSNSRLQVAMLLVQDVWILTFRELEILALNLNLVLLYQALKTTCWCGYFFRRTVGNS